MNVLSVLEERFGFPAFRPGQEQIVTHVVDGGDALVVMPTGAGKSLCYQVPAIARGGLAIVVSPLIALMKDQVDGMVEKGIRATFLNSSITTAEYQERTQAIQRGEIELLYVAPERFSPKFMAWLKQQDVRLFAVDEAHCLSQWGHDFRPDYLRLGRVRQALGCPPTMALTATATPEVQKDIIDTLGIQTGRIFIRGFDRENLILEVCGVSGKKEKDELLIDFVLPGPSLVYCATRKNVERAVRALREHGVRAGMYHAGLDKEARTRVQDDFMGGRLPVVVATNAFGMGVDKRDIRTIVHYDIPKTVEAYYQEIGRAGRDGRMSRAVLLFMPSDRRIQEFFINNAYPPVEWVQQLWGWLVRQGDNPVYARLEDMAQALPPEAGDQAVQACRNILVREGRARRIHPSDRAAWIEVRGAPGVQPRGLRGRVWRLIEGRGVEVGERVQFQPDAWASELQIERSQLTAALEGLADRRLLEYRPAERTGGVELFDPQVPLEIDDRWMRERRNREYRKLDQMEGLISTSCRRRYIVEYFGERAPFERCGTCDACRAGVPTQEGARRVLTPDEETVVLKVLANMARMEQHANKQGFSADLVAKTLCGSTEAKVKQWGFHTISTYGLLGPKAPGVTWQRGEVSDLLDALVEESCLVADYETREIKGKQRTYKSLRLAERGWKVMRRQESPFEMVFPHASKLTGVRQAPKTQAESGVSGALLASLREVRRQLSERQSVPPYVVASNKTLEELARLRPTTKRGMLSIHGMGKVRMARYGQPFMDTIRAFNEEA